MALDQEIQPVGAIAVERIERFIEQPKRRFGSSNPRQHRALLLARRKEPNGHIDKVRKSERIQRFAGRPLPEFNCPPQRQLAVKREAVVCKCERRSFDASALRSEQAGGKPDEARLPAAVGSSDLASPPRTAFLFQIPEHTPPPTPPP